MFPVTEAVSKSLVFLASGRTLAQKTNTMRNWAKTLGLMAFSTLLAGESAPRESTPIYGYQVVNIYPHDPHAFTQGLVYEDGILYEGTGLEGKSTLRKVDLKTGTVLQLYELSNEYFGEGITVWGDKIFQLTWESNIGFYYDKQSLTPLGQFYYATQGWGLTHDGQRLIMSDGSATLYFLEPGTFMEISRLQVTDENGPVDKLNELEYVRDEIFANVWPTERIARISPLNGKVLGWIDLTGLLGYYKNREVDVLNGIAYDANNDRLFVTGKYWPKLFEIKLIRKDK